MSSAFEIAPGADEPYRSVHESGCGVSVDGEEGEVELASLAATMSTIAHRGLTLGGAARGSAPDWPRSGAEGAALFVHWSWGLQEFEPARYPAGARTSPVHPYRTSGEVPAWGDEHIRGVRRSHSVS